METCRLCLGGLQADFRGSELKGADFTEAKLSGANLEETDLSEAEGLTWDHIKSAKTTKETKLPDYLKYGKFG